MVAPGDFRKFKDFDLNTDTSDDKYDDITLISNLKDYNIKQLRALKDYAVKQLPGKTGEEIQTFMIK